MKVHFFERKTVPPFVSIEKLFSVLKLQLNTLGVETVSFKNPYSLKNMLQSLRYFRKNQGEITHITGDIHWVALALNPKTTVLTIHDLAGLQYLKGIRKKIYYYLWIYLPIRKLTYITVISEKTKSEIVQLLPWASKKITVISNCLTIPLPENFEKTKNSIPKLLIVGTRSNKNIENAIKALNDIPCELHIVGDIAKEQIDYLKGHKITYTIYSDIDENDLIQLYKNADVLLFPSLYEGFGLPILEAQAYQCAVITSNISPMKEVAGNGAVLVNPYAVDEIANAIITVLKNDKLKEELIQKGLLNVKKYEPKLIAQCYLDLYQKILSENGFN
ncbi:MAG: glycosyltransferase family 1 protein [Bacteroidota bacterium]